MLPCSLTYGDGYELRSGFEAQRSGYPLPDPAKTRSCGRSRAACRLVCSEGLCPVHLEGCHSDAVRQRPGWDNLVIRCA
jgi:hypothetical protein